MKRIKPIPHYTIKTGKPLHPLMQDLYDKIIESGLKYSELEEVAGITNHSFNNWFCKGHHASLLSYSVIVESLGYKLEIVKDD